MQASGLNINKVQRLMQASGLNINNVQRLYAGFRAKH